jgi:tetratricopeptide (TPR) repeat protein
MVFFKKRAANKLVEEALVCQTQKDLKKAEELFVKAISIYDKSAEAHLLYGDLLKVLDRFKEAEKEYRRSIELAPRIAESHGALGELMHRMGNKADAEKEYKMSITLNPYYVNSYLNLATLYQDGAAFESMRKIYQQALPYVEDPAIRRQIEDKLR